MNVSQSLRDRLEALAERWPANAARLASYRLSPMLDRRIDCRIGGEYGWSMLFTRERLGIEWQAEGVAAAHVDLSEKDWADVLDGRLGIISMVFAGRCQFPKHERYVLSKLSIVLQSLATMTRQA